MTKTLEPAINPNNRIVFLLDWELTMKCNLDCSYCESSIYGGHDNSTQHPPIEECLKTVDFMLEYVNLYLQRRPKSLRYAALNLYGGESLHHPDIVKILHYVHERYNQHYKDSWQLTVTTTTNAIVANRILQKIIPYIDEFTCSYHCENSPKQKQQFKDNLLTIKKTGKVVKCVALMHADEHLFLDATQIIDWCNTNNIPTLPRQLDHGEQHTQFNYDTKQVVWFNKLYKDRSYNATNQVDFKQVENKFDLADSGRACCGGRQLCADKQYKERQFFVENQFPDWYCSVNQFFLYIKQVNGEIYTNKDCKMNFDGQVAPIGHLSDTKKLLSFTQEQLDHNSLPVIQCKKTRCYCGLCAPKAQNLDDYSNIMKKYQTI